MISKELLSKVLENEVPYQVKVHKIIIKNNSLNYFYNSKDSGGGLFEANEYINIYELAHKCKEWANNLPSKRYQLYSGICPKSLNYSVCSIFSGAIEQTEKIIANSELEAIFKACQWILDKDSK